MRSLGTLERRALFVVGEASDVDEGPQRAHAVPQPDMVEVSERSGDDDLTRSPDPAPSHQPEELDIGLGALPAHGDKRELEAPATDCHVCAQLVAGLDPGPGTAYLAGSD